MDVSVVIPVYNREDKISLCLDSVLSQQTRYSVEIIVVDDGSSDRTAQVLSQFGDKVRIIRIDNQGPSTARDTGIRAASGELIALLDSDDRMLPGRIELQATYMLENDEVDLSFGAVIRSSNENEPYLSGLELRESWTRLDDPFRFLITRNCECINTMTVMMRKPRYLESGGFNPALRCGEDTELWLKMARQCNYAYIGTPLAFVSEDSDDRLTKSPFVYLHGPTVILNALADSPALTASDFALARQHCRRSVNMMLRYDWLNCHGEHLQLHEAALIRVFGSGMVNFWRLINLVPTSIGMPVMRLARWVRIRLA